MPQLSLEEFRAALHRHVFPPTRKRNSAKFVPLLFAAAFSYEKVKLALRAGTGIVDVDIDSEQFAITPTHGIFFGLCDALAAIVRGHTHQPFNPFQCDTRIVYPVDGTPVDFHVAFSNGTPTPYVSIRRLEVEENLSQ